MGNWLRKSSHDAVDQEEEMKKKRGFLDDDDGKTRSKFRVKVVMTRKQLEDFMIQARRDSSAASGWRGEDLVGSLIFKECLEGKLRARVDVVAGDASSYVGRALSTGLSVIKEE